MAVFSVDPISVDEERARAFVLAHGGSLELARLDGAMPKDRSLVKELEVRQNPDGGFGSIHETLIVLERLKQMPPLAGSPMASRAVGYLRRSQATDGSWQETAVSAAELTAMAAFTLLTLEPEHGDPINRASAWLRQRADSGARALAFATPVWHKLHGPDEEGSRPDEQDAAVLSCWLTACLEVGLGGRFVPLLMRQLGRLAAMQGADGAWRSPTEDPMETTLRCVTLFRGYGVV